MTTSPIDPPTDIAQVGGERVTREPVFLPPAPGFEPELDYLATLEAFLEDDGTFVGAYDLAQKLTRKKQTQHSWRGELFDKERSGMRACFIDGHEMEKWSLYDYNKHPGLKSKRPKSERGIILTYNHIEYVRTKLLGGGHQGPCVMMVDNIDMDTVQLLGAALDLSPAILLDYLNPHVEETERSGFATMGEKFLAFVRAKRTNASGLRGSECDSIGGTPGVPTVANTALHENDWKSVHILGQAIGDCCSCRISCHRVSRNGWLILVGRPPAFRKSDTWSSSPFDRQNMLQFYKSACARLPVSIALRYQRDFARAWGDYHQEYEPGNQDPFDLFARMQDLLTNKISFVNPTRAESKKVELDLLFGYGGHGALLDQASFVVSLQWLLVASAWQSNINTFDRRLKSLSTTAMIDPSLLTFRPIPLLRQNVGDMEDALRDAKESIKVTDNEAFAELEKLASHRLQTLDDIFDTLLKQAATLSSTASNEIQLVIGSVTIQDSDTMKRQSRRATLLTLLAAFYLPLTLVTGIFGMNIKEFDDVKPSFVVCFEALFAVIAVTLVFYGSYLYLPVLIRESRRLAREWREDLRFEYGKYEMTSRLARKACLPFLWMWAPFLWLECRSKQRFGETDTDEGGYKLA